VSAKVIATGRTVEVLSNGERFDRAWEVHELTPSLIRVSIDGTVDWCDIAEVPKAWVPALIDALRAAGTGEGERYAGYRIKWDDTYVGKDRWSTEDRREAYLFATRADALTRLATLNEGWRDNARIVPVRRRGGKR
jgi:hypothetical protein